MAKLLVTGGADFIGSALVAHLLNQGRDLVVLDALTYSGRREYLENLGVVDCVTFVEGSAYGRHIRQVGQGSR